MVYCYKITYFEKHPLTSPVQSRKSNKNGRDIETANKNSKSSTTTYNSKDSLGVTYLITNLRRVAYIRVAPREDSIPRDMREALEATLYACRTKPKNTNGSLEYLT